MNKNKKIGIAFLTSMLLYSAVHAQLYISGISFTTQKNALVFVNGDVTYAGNAIQAVDHKGLLEMKGNWNNNALTDKKVFSDTSTGEVLMSAGLQTFNGANTRFPNLSLAGIGKKQQFTTIEIMDTLNLTDRELDVNGYTANVLWNDVNAVQYKEGGYVNTSASDKGWLIRNMSADAAYVFPLGNNNGSQYRYRPLIVTAQKDGNVFGQFQHYNPANDNYPTALKESDVASVNDSWFHTLTTDNAQNYSVNAQLPYNSITDGEFTDMVNWDNTTRLWKKIAAAGPVLNNQYGDNDNVFATTQPLVLTNRSVTPIGLATHAQDDIKIPNVITPNGDGYNESWVISNIPQGSTMDVVIFNRWNNVVYENKIYDNKWSGKGLNEGTYFFVLRLKMQNGTTKEYKGNILILR